MNGTLFCDESGYSGPNLFLDAEPLFVYTSLAIGPEHATTEVSRVLSVARMSGELKFGRLRERPNGPEIITRLLTDNVKAVRTFVANKRFATAGKFFEYVFEPILSDQSSAFYEIGFHRFISNVLYARFAAKDGTAEALLADVQSLVKERDAAGLKLLLGPSPSGASEDSVLAAITSIAANSPDKILEDIADLNEHEELGRWAMDLSSTALFMLLRSWGQVYESLEVICDESKPLKVSGPYIAEMVQADLERMIRRFGGARGRAVRLARPIEFHASKRVPGLQLADVFAGATRWSLNNAEEEPGKSWLRLLTPTFEEFSLSPDPDAICADDPATRLNGNLLRELARRAEAGEDLLHDLPAMIATARQQAG
ncbi:MAG: DUF3800 domain-containing protein [Planctomycetota bacterium]|nr:DUF3800 domain-containing protein [Planctomycetota bacterium]